jgi:hypothetical protein
MKKAIKKSQQYRAISRVLDNYPAAFAGKAGAIAAKNNFVSKSDDLAARISLLITPISSLYHTRVTGRGQVKSVLQNMIDMGIMLANRKQDALLLNTFKEFNIRSRSTSTPMMVEISRHVITALRENEIPAAELGVSTESVDAFETIVDGLEQTINSTLNSLDERRLNHDDINGLIMDCNNVLKLEMDRFVRFNETAFPAMHSTYMRLRRNKRRNGSNNLPAGADISGTVTDSLTGNPITFATINLIEQASVLETDADGYYLFDELTSGSYTVSCHANGYEVPEPVTITLGSNDSITTNFTLIPVAAPVI